MRLVFLGPPGAGKGTQAERLLRYLDVPHLSTGEMLRAAVAEQSAVGKAAEAYMTAGRLVPDPIILELVDRRLQDSDCAAGALFDGFPRTIPQARALDESLERQGCPLDVVLELRIPDEVALARMNGRGRCDDRPEVIAERLRLYHSQTQPLVDYYSARHVLETIDGLGSPDEVFERIRRAVDGRRSQRAARPRTRAVNYAGGK